MVDPGPARGDGRPALSVELTPREFALLEALARRVARRRHQGRAARRGVGRRPRRRPQRRRGLRRATCAARSTPRSVGTRSRPCAAPATGWSPDGVSQRARERARPGHRGRGGGHRGGARRRRVGAAALDRAHPARPHRRGHRASSVDAIAARLEAGRTGRPAASSARSAAGSPSCRCSTTHGRRAHGLARRRSTDPLLVVDGDELRLRRPRRRRRVRRRDYGASGGGAGSMRPAAGPVRAAPSRARAPVPDRSRRPTATLTVVAGVARSTRSTARSTPCAARSGSACPLVVALVGAVAWFVTGRALHPVEAMRAEAEAITHSTLHRRVPEPAAADEVGRLARTLNAMLDRLEGAADASAGSWPTRPTSSARRWRRSAPSSRWRCGPATRRRCDVAVEGALAEEARLEALLADLLLLASVEDAPPPVVDSRRPRRAGRRRGRAAPRRCPSPSPAPAPPWCRAPAGSSSGSSPTCSTTPPATPVAAVTVTVDGGRLVVDDDGPGHPRSRPRAGVRALHPPRRGPGPRRRRRRASASRSCALSSTLTAAR